MNSRKKKTGSHPDVQVVELDKFPLPKYRLKMDDNNPGLWRIVALMDFGDVRKGDIGGFVSSKDNLSHGGNCWIYDKAKVTGHAFVDGNAKIGDEACLSGNASAVGDAEVRGHATLCGCAYAAGNAVIEDNAELSGSAEAAGRAHIFGSAWLTDGALASDRARVHGNVIVTGCAVLLEDADVASNSDFIVFKNWWSSGRYFTWTRSNDKWSVGCFYGTGKELVKKAYRDSRVSGDNYKLIVDYVEKVKAQLKTTEKSRKGGGSR
jgi:carbonic anhydrase/acetyltransferase-like protein (isoleucine patch superfamily)